MIETLCDLLKQKDKKILFVGLGNILKNDDGVGVYISRRIKQTPEISVLTAEVSIENYIGKINSSKPDILVFIDCAEMHSAPGTCELFPVNRIHDITFNTHNISLKRLSDFFAMPLYILGIQPLSIDFGENISYLVKDVANKIVHSIINWEVYYGR